MNVTDTISQLAFITPDIKKKPINFENLSRPSIE